MVSRRSPSVQVASLPIDLEGRPGEPSAPAAAWVSHVRRHDRRVLVALLARGIDLARAKDLVQRAWCHLLELDRAGRLGHLELPGLAIRQALFFLQDDRRVALRRRESPLSEIDLDHDLVDEAGDAEARALSSERVARAREALARCSPSAQRVFHMVYGLPDRTHAEAARELGLSEQRVRQIICEVRARLRAAVEGGQS